MDGLDLIGVIETLNVVQAGNVERGDVVARGDGEVNEFAIIGDIRIDGDRLLGTRTENPQPLSNTLSAARAAAEGADDLHLTGADSAAGC